MAILKRKVETDKKEDKKVIKKKEDVKPQERNVGVGADYVKYNPYK